jgi:hypothetical protein
LERFKELLTTISNYSRGITLINHLQELQLISGNNVFPFCLHSNPGVQIAFFIQINIERNLADWIWNTK